MKKVILLFFAGLLLSCNMDSSRTLTGSWTNNRLQVVFMDEPHALWIVHGSESVDTFEVQYTYQPDSLPQQLDFYDFEEGTLQGLEMYGIIEFSENRDTFHYASEAARNSEEGATKRPIAFERGIMTFVRDNQ